jgi:hypothetical protein
MSPLAARFPQPIFDVSAAGQILRPRAVDLPFKLLIVASAR